MIASSTASRIAVPTVSECATDDMLRDAILNGLRQSGYRALARVQCEVVGGTVALSGVVPSFFLKQIAQTIIMRMSGVTRLTNRLEVQSSSAGSGLSVSHRGLEKLAS
jgi:osmotically-inducible protein OsmY